MLVAQFDYGSEGWVLFPCSRPSSAVSSYRRILSSSSCPPRLEQILSAFLKSHLLKTKCWPPLFPQDSHDVPPKPAGVSPGLYFLVIPLPTSHVFVGPLMSPSSLYLRLFHCGPFLPLSPNIYFLFFKLLFLHLSQEKKSKKKIHSLVYLQLYAFLPQKVTTHHKEPTNTSVFYHKKYTYLLWLPVSMALMLSHEKHLFRTLVYMGC